jgi:hypothetical protein
MGVGQQSGRIKTVTRQTLSDNRHIPQLACCRTQKSATYRLHLVRSVSFVVFRGKSWESADKPGSVVGNHSSGMHVTVHLERPTRKHARVARCGLRRMLPYLALLQAGFTLPSPLPSTRCALTAPFHPCRRACARLGGLLSVALSVGSRPPGVTWRRTLWSPDFPPLSCENGGCLADSRHQHSGNGHGPQAESPRFALASSSARA